VAALWVPMTWLKIMLISVLENSVRVFFFSLIRNELDLVQVERLSLSG
jgi:hypothetical protein